MGLVYAGCGGLFGLWLFCSLCLWCIWVCGCGVVVYAACCWHVDLDVGLHVPWLCWMSWWLFGLVVLVYCGLLCLDELCGYVSCCWWVCAVCVWLGGWDLLA